VYIFVHNVYIFVHTYLDACMHIDVTQYFLAYKRPELSMCVQLTSEITTVYQEFLLCILRDIYGLDGPRIESWWGRDFPHQSRPALEPTHPPVQWV